ncbi:ACP phosphodiesterase [Vibrio sp. NTOU-M3]|uniref:acyl carrier protein phosphodiesterase n=1 Tax=Vibrio sp. NTOU-M3 TaxID=3234954 RepID=UPI00349FC1E6
MNFLAHLHIAEHCDSSLIGNLLGDFVKGDPSRQFSPDIVAGIRLHRFVDSYTDSHSIMSCAKDYFTLDTRRFAGIALDVFWDHCLARHWEGYHKNSLQQFCADARTTIEKEPTLGLPKRYLDVSQHMWKGRWLESYVAMDNIEYALQRMSMRSPRMGRLADCYQSLDEHYVELSKLFSEFYPQILSAAKSQSF